MGMHCLLRAFAGPGRLRQYGARSGFTLVEIAIVLLIAGLLVKSRCLPTLIIAIKPRLRRRRRSPGHGNPNQPVLCRSHGLSGDPGGYRQGQPGRSLETPYQYLDVTDIKKTKGKARKDKNLVPINSDFDLYSMGKTAKAQHR